MSRLEKIYLKNNVMGLISNVSLPHLQIQIAKLPFIVKMCSDYQQLGSGVMENPWFNPDLHSIPMLLLHI